MFEKLCSRCRTVRPIDDFGLHKECKGGRDTACKPCRYEQRKAWRDANRERLAARRRAAYAADNGQTVKRQEARRQEREPRRVSAQNLAGGVWERSKKIGIECSPEFRKVRWIEAWLESQPNCECCGVSFHIGPKKGIKTDASPSFDRLRPAEGYVVGNVALICWRCNNIKRNYASADLRRVSSWMECRGL